ncbi:alpha/beta hydrolase, partial [Staphylococcus aureus]|uniref:alpha/beta hydrolase n=1 Tax=Staphylococcus aureus TaxID=1280 RepID=UPI0021B1AACD
MIKQTQKGALTKHIITPYISNHPTLTFKPKLTKHPLNPILKIQLQNNTQPYFHNNPPSFKNLLTNLQSQYNFHKFNFLPHSIPNLTFPQYIITYPNHNSLPHLNKQLNIPATFNPLLNINQHLNEITVDKHPKPSRINQPYHQL